MGFEQRINYQLNKHPKLKKLIKRIYQRFFYTFSKKIKYRGEIKCISPNDGKEYFFGYYDKSPWDSSGRYILCMQAECTWKEVSPKQPLNILLLDSKDGYKAKLIATSSSWNVQMGCMAQWLGPSFDNEIIYNDCIDGKYCSIILNVFNGKKRIIDAPVYSVSSDGKFALTLDFSRLYNLRPGYGYYNVEESTKGVGLPDSTCIWTVDLENNKVMPLLKYTDFSSFDARKEMLEEGTTHKVNHIMLSPNGRRFMVLYRWFVGRRKYTRLITCNIDGTEMYVLNDDDMVSHCFWKDDNTIIAYENKKEDGPGYYLMKDKTNEWIHLWPKYSNDGHPSYSFDRKYVVTDSYPNRKRMCDIKVLTDQERDGTVIAEVFAPFRYDNDVRCDLHPRWNRDNSLICFDGCFDGSRKLYVVNTNISNKD